MSAVFKWGSLVGISLPSSGAQGSNPFVAGNVEFRPREFTTVITTWDDVPWCATDFASYNKTAADHLATAHTAANFAKGIGDICRYMGTVDGATWRMPTAKDWEDLYGSAAENGGRDTILGNGWAAGNFYPLSGRAMGAGRNYVCINYETLDTDARVENADPWINGAVFLPASGYRLANGAIYSIGSVGYYWSSTAYATDRGYDMWFNSTTVGPQYPTPRAYGFSVRCIRE